jgi:O-antigen/teichoic acid export membrane protein
MFRGILFGVAAIVIVIDQIYGVLMNSIGIKGIRVTTAAAIILATSNIILNLLLIPVIGINGAMIATIISYIFSIIVILSKKENFKDA